MKATIGRDLLRRLPRAPCDVYDAKLTGFVLRLRATGTHSYIVATGRGRWFTLGRVGVLTPEKARARAQIELAKVAEGRDPKAERDAERARQAAERDANRRTHTLRSFLADVYAPWLEANRPAGDETLGRLKRVFASLLALPLGEITAWHLEKVKSARRKAKIEASTINRDIADLKALLARAVTWKYLPSHPLRELRPEKTDRRGGVVRYLTEDEEQRLREALHARDDERRQARESFNAWRRERGHPEVPPYGSYTDHLTPLVLLALNTGLRRGELLALRWRDMDRTRNVLAVRGKTTKTLQTRYVELNAEALQVLAAWRPADTSSPSALLFPGPRGNVMGDVKTAWRALITDAKITGFRFHDLRHTFASKLVQRGVPLQVVQELLGHSSIVMTGRYAHLAPTQRREAVELLAARMGS